VSDAHISSRQRSVFPPRGQSWIIPSPVHSVVDAARDRFEGSFIKVFLRRLAALDFADSIVLFGAALLLSVLPFIILLSSLANHQIDTDLSRHIGLNRQGALIVSQLFQSSPRRSTAAVVQGGPQSLLCWS
jgi:hypothetical protein